MTVTDERLETVRVEPRSLRSSPDDMSAHLIEAVNAALTDFRAHVRESGEVPDFDLREIATDLQKASEQFERDMRRNMTDAAETVAELRRSGIVVADLPTMEFDDLIGDLTEVLHKVDGGRDADDEELTGTGEAPRGSVRAVCVSDGRLDRLKLDARAMRGTVELERDVVTAVNAALDDLAARTRERRAEAEIDPEVLKRQLGQLRERNLARLESYYRALGDVIGGIEPQR
ncbi:MAG TPA: YbaB/EbfC family nucleoid-associated protein [Actinoallomurus sp.]|nr:YbaB/EbfC family nucleoid-associated protein [Actinoallomurus sp.]